jgi:hypothetical protein
VTWSTSGPETKTKTEHMSRQASVSTSRSRQHPQRTSCDTKGKRKRRKARSRLVKRLICWIEDLEAFLDALAGLHQTVRQLPLKAWVQLVVAIIVISTLILVVHPVGLLLALLWRM